MRGFQEPDGPGSGSSQYDLLFGSETLVCGGRYISELLVPEFGRHVLLCRDRKPKGIPLHLCEMHMGNFANPNVSVTVVKCWY